MRAASRPDGFTRLELAASVTLYLLFTQGLLSVFSYYQELGESTAASLTLQNLRSGLRYRMAEMTIRQGVEDFRPLLGENPVTWLEKPPDGYAGERRGDAADAAAGIWYFDIRARQLVYRPRRHRYLQADPGGEGRPELRFRAVGQTRAGGIAASGQPDPPVEGVRLEPLAKYVWFAGKF